MSSLAGLPSRLLQDERRTLPVVLAAGVALRVLVYWFLAPFNNDPHFEYVEFILEHGRPPFSDELTLGFHPPLYFALAAPVLALTGSAKAVQGLSLLFSLANLFLIYGFVRTTGLLTTARGRAVALLLAAFVPQFVLFSAYLSDDALAYPLGTAFLLLALRWVERRDRRTLVLMALVLGLGLLTKGTLLAFAPLAAALVTLVGLRERWTLARHAARLGLLVAIATLVGGFKFAQNAYRFGTPIVNNDHLGQRWIRWQQPVWVGPSTLYDVDVTKLVRSPFLGEASRYSVPLLLYGTFWYAHIEESNFVATRSGALTLFPRAIYATAVLPTLLILLGFGAGLWSTRRPLAALRGDERGFVLWASEALLLAAFLAELALVLAWGFKHDGWSFFQARVLFPAFLTVSLVAGQGFEVAARGRPRLSSTLAVLLVLFCGLLLAYLGVEMAAQLFRPA